MNLAFPPAPPPLIPHNAARWPVWSAATAAEMLRLGTLEGSVNIAENAAGEHGTDEEFFDALGAHGSRLKAIAFREFTINDAMAALLARALERLVEHSPQAVEMLVLDFSTFSATGAAEIERALRARRKGGARASALCREREH